MSCSLERTNVCLYHILTQLSAQYRLTVWLFFFSFLSLFLAAILSIGEGVDEMCLSKLFNSIPGH